MHLALKFYWEVIRLFEKVCMPILMLAIRLWIARIFWYSGLTKISHWQSTLYLFRYEYKIPHLSSEVAAYTFSTFELLCSLLLAIGLATRFAVLPLLVMISIIQLTYLNLVDHSYWCIMLATILFYGPGRLSMDAYIKEKNLFK